MKSFHLYVAVAACAAVSVPAGAASFISSNVSAQLPGSPASTQGTGVAGQIVSLNLGSGQSVSQAVTTYGANHAMSSSTAYNTFSSASSDWQIGFTLAGNGLALNTYVPLTISYSYDFALTAFGGFGSPSTGYYVSGVYGIAGMKASQGNPFDVFQVSATSNADGGLEQCKSKVPGAANPQQCLGSYAASGTVTQLANWYIGNDHIETTITAASALGAVDAYNTGLITGILVPDGITWTYDAGVVGNPLNFHYAVVSGTPEPGTLGILGFGLAATGAGRFLRVRKARRS